MLIELKIERSTIGPGNTVTGRSAVLEKRWSITPSGFRTEVHVDSYEHTAAFFAGVPLPDRLISLAPQDQLVAGDVDRRGLLMVNGSVLSGTGATLLVADLDREAPTVGTWPAQVRGVASAEYLSYGMFISTSLSESTQTPGYWRFYTLGLTSNTEFAVCVARATAVVIYGEPISEVIGRSVLNGPA